LFSGKYALVFSTTAFKFLKYGKYFLPVNKFNTSGTRHIRFGGKKIIEKNIGDHYG